MPELPEVQTVCDVIGPQVIGRRIAKVCVHTPEMLSCALPEFLQVVTGCCFASLDRRGKYLLFSLDGGKKLVMHLRMTGCLLVTSVDAPVAPHTRAEFLLDNGRCLRFVDQRRFGRMHLLMPEETLSALEKLGPEPFDVSVTAAYLRDKIGASQRTIKDCLLDQTVVAGVGNIYSDEILHVSKIHTAKAARDLTADEYEKLAQEIPRVMLYFVEKNAISPEKYLQTGGRDYQNTPYLRVYGRQGKACLQCGAVLEKRRVSGRGSVFCPVCQTI